MNCYVHAQKPAIGTCVNCGLFICEDCVTKINNKNYCKNCVEEVFNEKNDTIKNLEQSNQNNTPNNPTIVVNSSSSSSASASNSYGRRGIYPRQKFWIHILLFFCTAGIGNIIYFLYIKSQQNKWNRM